MSWKSIVPFIVLLGACCAQDFKNYFPSGSDCGLRYGSVIKTPSWLCKETKFQHYPGPSILELLKENHYANASEYLAVTKGCQQYHDNNNIYGENDYYKFESLCKMERRPVNVIWAQVPNFPLTKDLLQINKGLLPCHVLEGQNLFDVECMHPWAGGVPKHLPRRMARRLRRIRFTGVKRHLCLVGYAYNFNMVCKPTGFMTREVLVYSQHANMIFNAVVPDVPTSCACAYCSCRKMPLMEIPIAPIVPLPAVV